MGESERRKLCIARKGVEGAEALGGIGISARASTRGVKLERRARTSQLDRAGARGSRGLQFALGGKGRG